MADYKLSVQEKVYTVVPQPSGGFKIVASEPIRHIVPQFAKWNHSHFLNDIRDVSAANATDDDVLVRVGSVWQNKDTVKNADMLDGRHYDDIHDEILANSPGVLVLPFPPDDNRDYGASDIIQLVMDAVPISAYQFTDGATQRVVGRLRIEWGRDTLSTGQKVVTFQKAFREILEVFLQNKSSANPMYPTAVGTTGFTANGTGSDTFAWLAVGID